MFDGRIDHDNRVRKTAHFFNAFKVLGKLNLLFLELGDFLLRKLVPSAIGLLAFKVTEILNPAKDGAEIGQSATEPTIGDVEGARTDRFVNHDLLRLGFRPNNEDLATFGA